MLERKRPDVCWQVFVDGSDTLGSLGKPIGYLKPNSENKIVNLFIHPYNYEVALGLIDDLLRMNLSPSQQWKTLWEEYLKDIPGYYIPYLRLASLKKYLLMNRHHSEYYSANICFLSKRSNNSKKSYFFENFKLKN